MQTTDMKCRNIMLALEKRGVGLGSAISEELVKKGMDEAVGTHKDTHRAYLRALVSLGWLKIHGAGYEVVKMPENGGEGKLGAGGNE